MTIKNLSVFFPAYNEQENISRTVRLAVKFLVKNKINYEILVIDDGSIDNTADEVKKLSIKNKKIKLITHKKNRGYGGALRTGMSKAGYEWICFTDSDGQFNFSELERFFPHIESHDLIVGYRQKRKDNALRRLFARLLQWGDFILFGIWLRDIDCGFKLFKKEVVEKVWPLTTESAITETEFMVRAKRAGFKIKEVGVNHLARLEGIQTGGQIRIIAKAMKEALLLFWQLNFK
jgi:glycosyltransferase involved in cell wall biosynthesis